MTEPTQTTPSPIAVPWTPEMSSPPSKPTMQVPSQPQPQVYAPNPVQANPGHPTQQATLQAQSRANAQPMPQPYQAQQRPHLHTPTPVSAPSSVPAYPAQPHTAANPGHMLPTVPPVQQPPAPQAQRPQPMQPHHNPTPHAVPPQYQQQHQTAQQLALQPYAAHAHQTPQNLHAGPPPREPQAHSHLQATQMSGLYEEQQPQSKSFLAGLLKRSPRPDAIAADMPVASSGRESLFNKSFILGGLTGLVIGAFVLPIVIGMFSSDTSQSQARNFTQSSAAITPPSTAEGGSFIDDVIASDAP